MSSTAILTSLFQHKAWINGEFLAVLRSVNADTQGPERHTMIRLLNHILVVDQIFAAHLTGRAHGHAATNTPETPTLDELAQAVADIDQWYLSWVASASPEQLGEVIDFSFTDGAPGRMSREEMLAHVLTHGSYHRGEVGAAMKRVSVAPPRDLFTIHLHRSEPGRRLPR